MSDNDLDQIERRAERRRHPTNKRRMIRVSDEAHAAAVELARRRTKRMRLKVSIGDAVGMALHEAGR